MNLERISLPVPVTAEEVADLRSSLHARYQMRQRLRTRHEQAISQKDKKGKQVAQSLLTKNNEVLRAISHALYKSYRGGVDAQ